MQKPSTFAIIEIDALLTELTEDERITFLSWCNADFDAHLHLHISENSLKPGTLKRKYWGGESVAGVFEEDTFDRVECIYLPPLRDAETKLSAGTVKASINQKIEDALGPRLGQSVNLQFSEASFNRIVENIRLVFFPQSKETDITKFRDLATNSLGYNNLQIVNLTVATACI